MLIAFQVILLIVILISFMGVVAEKEDIELRKIMTYICIFSILAFLITVVIL